MQNPFQSVRFRMIISYLTIVLVIALLFGSVLYLFFAHQYRKELQLNKQMLLNSTVNYMESSVIDRVNQIYLSLALSGSVNVDIDTLAGNHSKILDIQQLLNQQVQSHADLVQAIHLYDTENRFMISSVHGLLLYENTPLYGDPGADWIVSMRATTDSSLWMPTRMVPQDAYAERPEPGTLDPLISYVHSYPFQSSGRDSKVIIAIDVKESAISGIMEDMLPADHESTYIVDQNGIILSAADKSLLGSPLKESAARQDKSHVISQEPFTGNNWTIYTKTPNKSFYTKIDNLKAASLLVCLLAVLVGIAMSSIFTAASYSPLRRILNNIKSRTDSLDSLRQNEYRFIDAAIDNLSNKVNSLEETLHSNHKIIKHNIILNMLNNRFTAEELAEQLQSIHVSTAYARFRCIIINPLSEKWKELQPRQVQHTLYSMIGQLEAAEFAGTRLLAEELQDHRIAVILCTNQPEEPLAHQIASFILSEARSRFGLEFVLALGGWVAKPVELHTSYREAGCLIQYSYFLPGHSVIQDLRLLGRETSNLEIPDSYLMNFERRLQARDLAGTVQAIQELVQTLKEGWYAAEYSRIILLKMVSIYADCTNQVRLQPAETSSMNLYKQYVSFYHIDRFAEWLTQQTTEFIQQLEKRSEVRSTDTIAAVRAYVREHISGDLTLEHVAEQVFISPKYLSKIFKEETGIAYSEYVTNQRMERARELLSYREFTVEQIANTVGYRTPAYFIKRFKEIHGCTPKHFMRSLTN